MLTSTTVTRVWVGGVVVVPDPPSHFNNQIFIGKDPDFVLSSNESNDVIGHGILAGKYLAKYRDSLI